LLVKLSCQLSVSTHGLLDFTQQHIIAQNTLWNVPMWTFRRGHSASAELHCANSENFLWYDLDVSAPKHCDGLALHPDKS